MEPIILKLLSGILAMIKEFECMYVDDYKENQSISLENKIRRCQDLYGKFSTIYFSLRG